MSPESLQTAPQPRPPLTWPLHLAFGWVATGLVSVVFHLWAARARTGSIQVEWLADAVDLGRHVGLGLATMLVVGAFRRFIPGPAWLPWLAFALLSLSLGAACLPTDLDGLAERLSEDRPIPPDLALGAVVVGISGAVPGLAWVTRARTFDLWSRRRWLRGVHGLGVLGLAVAMVVLNVSVSPGSNPSAHLFLSWATALLLAHAMPPLEIGPGMSSRWLLWAGAATLSALWAGWALLGPHSNTTMIRIARRASALHLLASFRTDGGLANIEAALAAHAGPFFADRARLPPVPPSAGRPSVDRPIAIFMSIDSLRADVPTHAEHSKYLPNLLRMMGEGANFSAARAPGSMTKYTLSTISTGKYFSQQYWTRRGETRWPVNDESVHMASVLAENGVYTAAFPGMRWLQSGIGILEGFQQNEWVGVKPPKRYQWVPGEVLTETLIANLEANAARSGLYFVHYLDSHDPFDKVRKTGSKFRRYLECLRVVDGYFGQIRQAVERLGLGERTLFIATSDHGEAFGEHGEYFHGGTLYDELVRVPLVVLGPGVVPRQIDVPVSLVDVGPTLLDWFGAMTPAAFMGESLVPLLIGGQRSFSRPIVAETRLKQSILFADGFKAIRDLRRQTLELYDLKTDPLELKNLSDSVDVDHEEHILLLRSFFQVHTFREHGYRVPFVK